MFILFACILYFFVYYFGVGAYSLGFGFCRVSAVVGAILKQLGDWSGIVIVGERASVSGEWCWNWPAASSTRVVCVSES